MLRLYFMFPSVNVVGNGSNGPFALIFLCSFWLDFHAISLGLLEERALLLGRMGKHEQALFIYVHILKDTNMAEK